MSVLAPHDVVVIGGGVVGLSVARSLALAGRRVLVLEREVALGKVGTSRSSGVLHAGLHHSSDWLKTRLCLRGRPMLEAYCSKRAVPIARTGKWIVACDAAEAAVLERLSVRARERHLTHRLVDGSEMRALEPALAVYAGLLVEATGVVRTAELVRALVRDVEDSGGEILIGVQVQRITANTVELAGDIVLEAHAVVIAAGLSTDTILLRSGVPIDAAGLRQRPAKGEWLALSERHRKAVSRHVYPVPHEDGAALGIHLTRDLDGYLYAGPDLSWEDGFALTPAKIPTFGAAVRRYYPGVSDDELFPLMAGVRPKLSGPGEPPRDFLLWRGDTHGLPGVVALLGIESPGLTACLALGEHVAEMVG